MSNLNQRDKALYVDLVRRVAQQSRARRLQVGAMLVNNGNCVIGYNGTPAGWDNNCEDEVEVSHERQWDENPTIKLVTKPEVIHAEMNVFKKVANNPGVIKGGTLFITHSPCIECAKLFLGMGLEEVIYLEDYQGSRSKGFDILEKDGIKITKWEG